MTGEFGLSFFMQLKDTFFNQYANRLISPILTSTDITPFRNHPQIPAIIDILNRQSKHHITLTTGFSPVFNEYLIEALMHHTARGTEAFFLDIDHLVINDVLKLTIEKDFQAFHDALNHCNHYVFIVLNNITTLLQQPSDNHYILRLHLIRLLKHPKCRFIIFTHPHLLQDHPSLAASFQSLLFDRYHDDDIFSILKRERANFQEFHQITIPDELLPYSYLLAKRYLNDEDPLANAILLLDSASARANRQKTDHVTYALLLDVLSAWTQIPAAQLDIDKFNYTGFVEAVQECIIGQHAAISLIGQALQQATFQLQERQQPFCSFLFTGSFGSGKKSTAIALAKQLYKKTDLLYLSPAQLIDPPKSLLDLRVQCCADKRFVKLAHALTENYFIILLIQQVEQLPIHLLNELNELINTGLLCDEKGNTINFRQSIIILTSTLGNERLNDIAATTEHKDEQVNLMQLILSEQMRTKSTKKPEEPQELVSAIMHDITAALPSSLVQALSIAPFLPLDKKSIEKIMLQKITMLNHQLSIRYNIELTYALEAIHYLTDDAMAQMKRNNQFDFDKTSKKINLAIEHALMAIPDNKPRSTKLCLQLNETGEALHCDWLTDVVDIGMLQHNAQIG